MNKQKITQKNTYTQISKSFVFLYFEHFSITGTEKPVTNNAKENRKKKFNEQEKETFVPNNFDCGEIVRGIFSLGLFTSNILTNCAKIGNLIKT